MTKPEMTEARLQEIRERRDLLWHSEAVGGDEFMSTAWTIIEKDVPDLLACIEAQRCEIEQLDALETIATKGWERAMTTSQEHDKGKAQGQKWVAVEGNFGSWYVTNGVDIIARHLSEVEANDIAQTYNIVQATRQEVERLRAALEQALQAPTAPEQGKEATQ